MTNYKTSAFLKKASEQFKCSKRTMYRILEKYGIERIREEITNLPQDKLMTPNEAANIIRCSPSVIYNHSTGRGELPYYKIFGMVRIKVKDLQDIIDSGYMA